MIESQRLSTVTVVTCLNSENPGHTARDCKKQLTSIFELEKSGEFDNGRRKWCSHHNSKGDSKENYHQMEKSEKSKNGRNKWCGYHNSNGHLSEECYHQKSGNKSKDSSTLAGKSSEKC